MDKWRTKLLWQAADVPTAPFELLEPNADFDAIVVRLGLPIMVKPANEGSSLGMSRVQRGTDLRAAFKLASRYDPIVIAEKYIDGPELTVGVLGEVALPVIRLETPREFYDYDAKYVANDTRYIHPCGLPPEKEKAIQRQVMRAFNVLGCCGWGRVDLMLNQAGEPFFLEVNTSPGMTDHSLVPMAARHAGLTFEDLCIAILEGARLNTAVANGR